MTQLTEWEIRMAEEGILELDIAAKKVGFRVFGFILDNPYKQKTIQLINMIPSPHKDNLITFTGDDVINQVWNFLKAKIDHQE